MSFAPVSHDKQSSSILAWKNIVKEVMARKAKGQKASIFSDDLGKKSCTKITRDKSKYKLDIKHGCIYLTKREAECMDLLLQGKSTCDIAKILNISPRTTIDYVNNIKIKSNCATKSQLLDIVRTENLNL